MNDLVHRVVNRLILVAIVGLVVALCSVAAAVEWSRATAHAARVWARRASAIESRRRARSPQRHLPFVWTGFRNRPAYVARPAGLASRTEADLADEAALIQAVEDDEALFI